MSFGAWIALACGAADPRVSTLIGIATPAARFDFSLVKRTEEFAGQRQATVSGSDISPEARAKLLDRVMNMARLAPEDPFPAGVEDALAAVRWAHAHRERLGGNAFTAARPFYPADIDAVMCRFYGLRALNPNRG